MFDQYQICILRVHKINAAPFYNPFAKSVWQWQATVTSLEGDYDYPIATSHPFAAYGGRYPRARNGELALIQGERDTIRRELIANGWEPLDSREFEQTWRRRLPIIGTSATPSANNNDLQSG